MRTIVQSLAFVSAFAMFAIAGGSQVASAAPPARAEALKPITIGGVLTKMVDGRIVLRLELKDEQRTQVLHMPQLENGVPSTPGRLGVQKGEIFACYMLDPTKQLEATFEKMMGKHVDLELDRALHVQRVVNAP